MNGVGVKTAFDASAQTYDRARRQLIPCFDEFYATALARIPFSPDASFRVLDLGAGTGLLSYFVAGRFPRARITLMDISAAMLNKARERFAGAEEGLEFVVADYAEGFDGEFEVVVSALSIHHLADDRKARLFRNIHAHLADGGLFINADQVLGSSPETERVYRTEWLRQVRDKGVSEMDLTAALGRMQEDRMTTLESQLNWLEEAGFRSVNCWYKHYSFVVYSGVKGRVGGS